MGYSREIQDQIADNQKTISVAEALEQLQHNPTFSTLVYKHLLGDRVLTLVKGLALYAVDSVDYSETIRELDSLSRLNLALQTIMQNGEVARISMQDALDQSDQSENA